MRYASYTETYDEKAEDPDKAHQYHFTTIQCPIGGSKCQGGKVITVYGEDLFKYQSLGALIQDAFPYLSPGDRQQLMSGHCDPCYEELFSEEED